MTLVSDRRQLHDIGEYIAQCALADGLTISDTWIEVIALTTTLSDMCANTDITDMSNTLSTATNRDIAQTFLKYLSDSVAKTLYAHNCSLPSTTEGPIKSETELIDQPTDSAASDNTSSETDKRDRWLHDLKSPLQAALLRTELALMDDPIEMSSSEIRQELEDIRLSIERSIALIKAA